MTRVPALAAALAAILAGAPAAQRAVFRSGVELVRLDVSVTRGGQPVRGLTARDFTIVDNGVAQRVESVTAGDDLPVNVLMALDVSGSVKGERLQHLVAAGRGLTAALRPDDRVALVTFSRSVRTLAPLTRDRGTVDWALGSVQAGGPTAIRDAVWTALNLRPDDDSRSMVLVFTDGIDNASWLSISQLLTGVSRLGVVVHAVNVGFTPMLPAQPLTSARAPARPEPFLEALVNAAGGRQWSATSSRDLKELFTRAIDEMRARYLVTFYPAGPAADGWHELKVTVSARGEVRARPGYFVAPRQE
jgi:Ca-activated chloride channel homolog